MPRRAAAITQADVARVIRAEKQAGASEVVVQVGDKSKIIIRLLSTGSESALEESGEIVL
jgi:2-iminoacetate synthase ThiH